jgi:hypothetical protein
MTQAVALAQQASTGVSQGFKNRIINGAMVIDQRNAGASVATSSGTNVFTLDRWQAYYSATSKYTVQQNAGSVTPPVGFTNYLGVTSSSAYSVGSGDYFLLTQRIEGYNVADLGWGTANAKTVTLSFWVRSSLTGTFGGSVLNSSNNRSYPFTYTISSANTWEYKTITIAGDTTGTWLTTNGSGLEVFFGLGVGSSLSGTAGSWSSSTFFSATGATSVVGTNGATFYITGVQLEVGSTATSFDYLDYGRSLIQCQRYYYRVKQDGVASARLGNFGQAYATTTAGVITNFPVEMRTSPTAVEQSGTAGDYRLYNSAGSSLVCTAVPAFGNAGKWYAETSMTVASGLVAGNATNAFCTNSSAFLGWSAEL